MQKYNCNSNCFLIQLKFVQFYLINVYQVGRSDKSEFQDKKLERVEGKRKTSLRKPVERMVS